jgi:hypothetical protein
VTLDAVEETGVLLSRCQYFIRSEDYLSKFTYRSELCQHSSVRQTEDLVAEDGPNQPAHGHHAKRAQSHQHERVQAAQLRRQGGVIAVGHHGGEAVVGDADGSDDRTALPDPAARSAERKEVVPCELRLRCWGGAGRGMRGCR